MRLGQTRTSSLQRNQRTASLRGTMLLAGLLFALLAATHAQQYTSIVVFGDSLSDIGNVADLTQAKYGIRIPGPIADYTDGRFTDGFDTIPPARSYEGVWVEQLAALLKSKPPVSASLDGGTDYAYGFATTGPGTGLFTFGPSDSLFVYVDNVGQQITDYLATHPKIDDKTLFVVWGGAIDVLYATSTNDVVQAALRQSANVQRLIHAGATSFLVLNLPPLGDTPRLNGSTSTSVPANQASALYNATLNAGLTVVSLFDPLKHVEIERLDVFRLFNAVLASPATYGLSNVTGMSQGDYLVDPDTFLFWDDLHPTTHGHEILALAALRLVDPQACEERAYFGEMPECPAAFAVQPNL